MGVERLLGEWSGGYAGDVSRFDRASSSNMRKMMLAERNHGKSKSSICLFLRDITYPIIPAIIIKIIIITIAK